MKAFCNKSSFISVLHIRKYFNDCLPDRHWIRLIKFDSGPKLPHPLSNASLLRCLRQHYKGYPKVEALIDAVHSAVGNKHIRLLKHCNLVDMGKHGNILRKHSKVFCRYQVTD